MSSDSASNVEPGGAVLQKLVEFDKSLSLLFSQTKKLHERIGRSVKSMKKGVSPKELEKLIEELSGLTLTAPLPQVAALADSLRPELPKVKKSFAGSFERELKTLCEQSSIALRQHGDGLVIGPCIVTVDAVRERAEVNYAKYTFARLPMHAATVLESIDEFKKSTLDRPVDLKKTKATVDEAVRVSLARKSKPAKGSLRIELPALYREMKFIRDSGAGSKGAEDFSLPRFVIEIARLLKSDENLNAASSYSLETAVIENANNQQKSIFIPRDPLVGHGDGMFYQAIVQSL